MRDPGRAVVSEMFGADIDEDEEIELELELDDEEFGVWSAPSTNTLEAARAFSQAMNLDVQPMVGDPAGHWIIDYRRTQDLDQSKRAAATISIRYRVQWVLLDDGQAKIWAFLPK